MGREGQQYGTYRLDSLLGQGHHGEVYLAQSISPHEKNVLLELLKMQFMTIAIFKQFKAELSRPQDYRIPTLLV